MLGAIAATDMSSSRVDPMQMPVDVVTGAISLSVLPKVAKALDRNRSFLSNMPKNSVVSEFTQQNVLIYMPTPLLEYSRPNASLDTGLPELKIFLKDSSSLYFAS